MEVLNELILLDGGIVVDGCVVPVVVAAFVVVEATSVVGFPDCVPSLVKGLVVGVFVVGVPVVGVVGVVGVVRVVGFSVD